MAQNRTRRRLNLRLPLWLVILLFVGILVFLLGSGILVFRNVFAVASELPVGSNNSSEPQFSESGSPLPAVVQTDEFAAPQIPSLATNDPVVPLPDIEEIESWQGTRRVTILLLGIDRRCGEEGPVRTDSMMLATIDPVSKTAGLLSIPRDLWVEIPGFGVDRINQAHYLGEGFEYPGGGPALAVETVEATLGLPIDYYATVSFAAFTEGVDLLGGIEIDVPVTIDDPDYPDECYGYDPFFLEAGQHTLDGVTALKYARTRATEGGDVDRADRQQEVILAVRNQAIQQIPDLLVQAPQLWQTFQKNVKTTISLDEIVQLALLVQEIPAENIRRAVIDYNHVYVEKTPEGQDVLVPIRENIRALRDELLAVPQITAELPSEELLAEIAKEGANIGVYNGTAVFGLAGLTEAYLVELGLTVSEVGNADSAEYANSQIIDFGDHPYTVSYLTRVFSVPPLNISEGQDPTGDYDLLVILGNNWEIPPSPQN